MNPLSLFLAFIARRRAAYSHARAAKRLDIITQQIADRRANHRAWKHLVGELCVCRRTMLECEIVIARCGGMRRAG